MTHNCKEKDIAANQAMDEPLFDTCGGCGGDEDFVYDTEGSLTLAHLTEPLQPVQFGRPCKMNTLNGSWLLTISTVRSALFKLIRGPMRIEVDTAKLCVSGDIYVSRFPHPSGSVIPGQITPKVNPEIAGSFVPESLVIRKNWYPAFPQNQYRWYFRSLGAKYINGELGFKFERHLWSPTSQCFVSQDTGWMKFNCRTMRVRPVGAPRSTIEMQGEAMIGGTRYILTATKTSPYYRGCLVEVDVMSTRKWPASASSCDGGRSFSFTSVYRKAGMDFRAVVNEINVPNDSLLSIAEMHTLLSTHRSLSAGGNNWHLWLLVGSRNDGSLGIMFDTGNPPHREGAIGFYDATLQSIDIIHAPDRGKKLGEVPLAMLRTMIHEAGHAFNLWHPKQDVHGITVSTTIMNQTGDVMGFATTTSPYPCNATFDFNQHNRTSLIHSPDPQVKPGWKEFGWGHGRAWNGIAEPIDVAGLDKNALEAPNLKLDIALPSEAARGEYIGATLTVVNAGNTPQAVTTALNLAEGDLKMTITTPSGQAIDARDVVLLCGPRRMRTLQAGESLSGSVQLFYGPHGLTFDQPGRYEVRAELAVGDGTVVRSAQASLVIRPASADEEREIERLTMDTGVGLSLAIGDFGTDNETRNKLFAAMDRFAATETGAACAMVLSNAFSRDLRDIRGDRVLRTRDDTQAGRAFEATLKGRDAVSIVRLSTAVVSARDTTAPLLDMVQKHLKKVRKGTYSEKDKQQATQMIQDHLD